MCNNSIYQFPWLRRCTKYIDFWIRVMEYIGLVLMGKVCLNSQWEWLNGRHREKEYLLSSWLDKSHRSGQQGT